jgi:hypothetical protein
MTQIPATLKRYAHRIDEVEDDRGNQNGWWVYLVPGLCRLGSPQEHIVHEDTLAICAQEVRDAEPCDCDDCRQCLAERAAKQVK